MGRGPGTARPGIRGWPGPDLPHDIAEKTQGQGEHPGEVPMISMGKNSGARAGMGPKKCLMYLAPWYLTPR